MEISSAQSTQGAPLTDAPPAHIGLLAHLYRGELYRSKIWRMRLDTTTNWAVATTGISFSVAFSDRTNDALSLLFTMPLILIFWGIESRRYRYFDIWRTRVRVLERQLMAAVLKGQPASIATWGSILADDYAKLRFHISVWEALGRRLRRNYLWIFLVLGFAFLGKTYIHPSPAESLTQFHGRASVGNIDGVWIVTIVEAWMGLLVLLSVFTSRLNEATGRVIDDDLDLIQSLS
jgi:uncharacterized membrane protein